MSLAKQLEALCREHGLSALSVEIYRSSTDGSFFFGSYAHAEEQCGSATHHRDTPHASIGEAIADLHNKLGRGSVHVAELEEAA